MDNVLDGHEQMTLTKASMRREPKAIEDKHYRRTLRVLVREGEGGNWWIQLNREGSWLPATDAEVQLWNEVQALKRARQGSASLKA